MSQVTADEAEHLLKRKPGMTHFVCVCVCVCVGVGVGVVGVGGQLISPELFSNIELFW